MGNQAAAPGKSDAKAQPHSQLGGGREVSSPSMPSAQLFKLQSAIGNRAMSRLLGSALPRVPFDLVRQAGGRIETGAAVDDQLHQHHARAATLSDRVLLRSDVVAQPEAASTWRTLAHEAGHVLQQRHASGQPASGQEDGGAREHAESDADRAADVLLAGGTPIVGHREAAPVLRFLLEDPAKTDAPVPANRRKETRPRRQARSKPEPPATALAVMKAIVDILKGSRPQYHPAVPSRYKGLLGEWHQIRAGHTRSSGGIELLTTGALLQTYIQLAMRATMPLIEVLADQGDKQVGQWLASEFFPEVDRLGYRALKEEVSESIEAAAEAASPEGRSDLDAAISEAELKVLVKAALTATRQSLTTVNRFLSKFTVADNKEAKQFSEEQRPIQHLSKQVTKAARDAGERPVPGALLKPAAKMSMPQTLWFIKGGLDGIDGILAIADPEKRKELFATWQATYGAESGVKVSSAMDILIVFGEFVFGATSLLGSIAFALSSAVGNASLAAQLQSLAVPTLMNIQVALNALGVIHGAAILLENEATTEGKVKAVFEIAFSGMGVAAKIFDKAKPFSGPVTAAIVIAQVNFFTIKTIVGAGEEVAVNLVRAGLNACFDDMRKTAQHVQRTSAKLAAAAKMAASETNPERKKLLDEQIAGLHWNLVHFFLKPYLERATRERGAGNNDPAAYGPSLIDRFKPLADRNMDTVEEALEVAYRFVRIVATCHREAGEILNEVVLWTWKEHG